MSADATLPLTITHEKEEKKMFGFFHHKKRIAYIFIIGFFIGFLLEILFVELGKNPIRPEALTQDENLSDVTLTCIILMKHDHDKNLIASESTWLPHCNQYFAFRMNRTTTGPKIKKSKRQNGSCTHKNAITTDHKMCDKQDAFASGWNRTRKKIIQANNAWHGLCKALHFVKSSKTQWFLIVPDNLFVLPNNLKYFVKNLDYQKGHYFGYVLNNYMADYNALSAGILISLGALEALMNKFKTEIDCDSSDNKFWSNEDLYLGKYLKELGISPQDTRDELGRGRFHGYSLNVLFSPGKLFNESTYNKRSIYPHPTGVNCCSPSLITVDVPGADRLYLHYYYSHKIETKHKSTPPPQKHPQKEDLYWKEFLRAEGYSESAIENMTQDEYYNVWVKKMPPELFYQKIRKMVE